MNILWIFRARSMRGQVGAFVLGFIAVALTLELRIYLEPHVETASLIFFVPAILLTSAVGGVWAGVFATLLSCAFSAYFLLPPLHSLEVDSPFALMTMSVLALTGLFIASICELLRKTIRLSEAANAKLEAALRCMTEAVFITDADGASIQVNEAFATIHKFHDVAQCLKTLQGYADLLEAFMPDGRSIPFEEWPISRALRGETGLAEISLRRKDTGESWIASINFAPIVAPGGAISGAVLTERDVTEQKENDARLEAMRSVLARTGRLNDLGQVSAGLAHELNQPLAAMLNYSNVAKRLIANRKPALLEKAYDAISKATDQAVRAAETILKMRAFIENRESSRALENINAIVEDAMAVGLMGAQAENVTTHLALAADMPPIFADRIQIQQVLVNLLRNAVEAMANSHRRELTISTTVFENSAVEVAVIDTGSGIPRELADNLFMPFVTSKPGGMGIGLVISQSIIEAHGGRIQVESNLGGGTRFHFRLPAVELGRAAA